MISQCREAFFAQSGNTEFIYCLAAPIHAALTRVCRQCGMTRVPLETQVADWIVAYVPGERLGQVLSFQEFLVCARFLCPGLNFGFETTSVKQTPGEDEEGVNIQAASKSAAYGLAQRKDNATALFDYDNPRLGSSSTESSSAIVMVTDPETLAAAVKEDGRRSRRAMLDAGQKQAPVHTRRIERDRFVDYTRVGHGPSVGVRAQKEAKLNAKARRDYSRSLGSNLSCNVGMVSRHLGREDDTRRANEQKYAVRSVVDQRRFRAEAMKGAVGLVRQDELQKRRRGRQDMVQHLDTEVRRRSEAERVKAVDVREARDVLHWSENTSALIPADEDASLKKTAATNRSEWTEAVQEEESRVVAIRQQRLLGFVQEKHIARVSRGATLPSAAVSRHLDGSEVMVEQRLLEDNGAPNSLESMVNFGSPAAGEADISGYFYAPPQQELDDVGFLDVAPPMHMEAAQRAFGRTKLRANDERKPGFLSAVSKSPLPDFYASTVSGSANR